MSESDFKNETSGSFLVTSTGLRSWNLYFLVKLLLYYTDYIDFDPLLNLGFTAFLLLPLKAKFVKIGRQIVAIPLGIALLYHDSWLPPFHRLLSESTLIGSFNTVYLLELAGRFINVELLALLMVLWVAYLILSRFIRVTVIVVGALIFMTVSGMGFFQKGDLSRDVADKGEPTAISKQIEKSEISNIDQYLTEFYRKEQNRTIDFQEPRGNDTPFDIIFLHICSLSWNDLTHSNMTSELPFFDIEFTSFNTVATYSGPAVIRLLRAGCGQSKHDDLYSAATPGCYLFQDLKQVGFENELVFNHDGHFDDFLGLIKDQGVNEPLFPLQDHTPPLKSFDGSPVYGDFEILSSWWSQRITKPNDRSVVLYNTVTMHDGNRYVDNRSRMSSTQNFALRLQDMLSDFKKFFYNLEKSGRNVVVVMIPEHGAAIQGDRMQISGLREIPSPSITLAPVGIRLIGPKIRKLENPIRITEPTSYFDLTNVIAKIISTNPFDKESYDLNTLTYEIDGTQFVSENAEAVVLDFKKNFFFQYDKNSNWVEYQQNGKK